MLVQGFLNKEEIAESKGVQRTNLDLGIIDAEGSRRPIKENLVKARQLGGQEKWNRVEGLLWKSDSRVYSPF